MRWAFPLAVLSVLVAGCSAAGNSLAATPADVDIDATASFTPFKNSLGDQLEALNVHITSDIPMAARVQVDLSSSDDPLGVAITAGDLRKACDPEGCLLSNGDARVDWWCSVRCPAGTYTLTLNLCSYAENKEGARCNHQEQGYIDWVGNLGSGLKGNPLAAHDPDHPAVLNLQRVITFTH